MDSSRHGIGEPYLKSTHNDLTTKAMALLGRHDPMFEAIVEAYCDLDDNDREVILKSLQNLVSAYNEKRKSKPGISLLFLFSPYYLRKIVSLIYNIFQCKNSP